MNLQDLRILVTGAASGMGRAYVHQLLRAGAKVAAVDLSEPGLRALALEAGAPAALWTRRCDVSDEADVVATVREAAEALGGLNALINNAGIFRDGYLVRRERSGALRTMSLADWNAVIAVDLTGPFLLTREVASWVIEHDVRSAVIVNISSIARHGNAGQGNYSAAKAGLVADTKLWAEELARFGIRVGAVAPGLVRTPMIEAMPPAALERIAQKVPLGRVAEPDELWLAVRFVLECDYFTGRCIDVDGGLSV
jgi:3-oxoacyl-[acyl-carrier protein] reductase